MKVPIEHLAWSRTREAKRKMFKNNCSTSWAEGNVNSTEVNSAIGAGQIPDVGAVKKKLGEFNGRSFKLGIS